MFIRLINRISPSCGVKLKPVIAPAEAAFKKVTWTSSDPNIVKVSTGGVLTAVSSSGRVTITATAKDGSGKRRSCVVTVGKPVTGVKLNRKTARLTVESSLALKASVIPSTAAIKTVTWKSNNPRVATVDANGIVTALSPGKTTITVTSADGKYKKKCAITVY